MSDPRRIVLIGYTRRTTDFKVQITNIYELKEGAEDPHFNFRHWYGFARHDNDEVLVSCTNRLDLPFAEQFALCGRERCG